MGITGGMGCGETRRAVWRVKEEGVGTEHALRILLAFAFFVVVFTPCGQGQDDPGPARERWQQKAAEFQGKDESDCRAAVRALDRPPHAHGEHRENGWSVCSGSTSGLAFQVDADWWIVREAA